MRSLSHDSDIPSPKVRCSLLLKPSCLTLNVVSKSKIVLFGGATGDTGKYIITGDTYALDLISYKWTKLEGMLYSYYQLLISCYRFRYRALTKSSPWQLLS